MKEFFGLSDPMPKNFTNVMEFLKIYGFHINNLYKPDRAFKIIDVYIKHDIRILSGKQLIHYVCEICDSNIILYYLHNIKTREYEWLFEGWKPIHLLCCRSNDEQMYNPIHYLIIKKVDLEAFNVNGWKPIHFIMKFGTLQIINMFMRSQVNKHCLTMDGQSPLYIACRYNNPDIVKYALNIYFSNDLNKNIKRQESISSIYSEISLHSELNIISAILQNNNCKNDINLLKYVIQKGANVNIGSPDGWFPIHYACLHCNLETIEFIIESGANLNLNKIIKNNIEYSPYDLMMINKNVPCNNHLCKLLQTP